MAKNNNNNKEVVKILKRSCVICGKKLTISVFKDRKYEGGEYFGKIFPKRGEYWECKECYQENANLQKEKI